MCKVRAEAIVKRFIQINKKNKKLFKKLHKKHKNIVFFILLNENDRNRPICSGWTYRSKMNTSLKCDLAQVQINPQDAEEELVIVDCSRTRKLQEK